SGSGSPGEVVAIHNDEIEVAAADGSIKIARVRADAGKISASDYVSSSGLKVGDVLGDYLP
ncbi:MAG: methionyl-tRNA formyltransferase, partial [bacterium]